MPQLVPIHFDTEDEIARCPAAPILASEKASYAYYALTRDWPTVITSVIDDVYRTLAAQTPSNPDHIQKELEGKRILQDLAALKYELSHNKFIQPIKDDDIKGTASLNSHITTTSSSRWLDLPYIFAECYLSRRIYCSFSLSEQWRQYDPFFRKKQVFLEFTRPTVQGCALGLKQLVSKSHSTIRMTKSTEEEEAAERLLFKALCTACSNTQATSSAERLQEEKALEISSLFNGSLDTLQKAKAIQETEGRILIDHTDYAYKVLSEVRGTAKNDRTVYIILSGAGYELVTDLILASFLIISQLATKVILQARAVPFGKFCTLNDYQNLLLFLQTSPQPEQADLQWLHDHLTSLQAEGKLEVRSHNAWHLLTSYWHLPKQYPSLYQECQKAALVILKGDFHYRKLTCDAHWAQDKPFSDACGSLGKGSGIRILALRPIQSDVLVGCAKDKSDLARERDGVNWKWTGLYGMMQYSDGRSREHRSKASEGNV